MMGSSLSSWSAMRTSGSSIQTAAKQDYDAFYAEEIASRDILRYPPISHMMSVQIQSRDEEEGMAFSNRLRALMEQQHIQNAVFIGPALATIGRINDVYRIAVYVKLDDYDGLILLKDVLEKYIKDLQDSGRLKTISVQFDFDPVNGF